MTSSAVPRLPCPSPGFAWTDQDEAWGPVLRCAALAPTAGHLFTTAALTLDGGGPEGGAGWALLADVFGAPATALVRLKQVHGANVVIRRRGGPPAGADLPAGDIVITDDPALVLVVQTADCVPLLVADRRTGVVAAAHAGWRGTAAGVPRATVEALQRVFGVRPADLIAVLGPSIGRCCYEVGDEVRLAFLRAGHRADAVARWFTAAPGGPAAGGRPHLDLWAANVDQLTGAGVAPDAVHVSGLCTAHHTPVLCSYRRDGPGAGRLAAAIRMAG